MSDRAKIVYGRIAAEYRREPSDSRVFQVDELLGLGLSEFEVKDGLEHLRGSQLLTRMDTGFVLTEEGVKACKRSEDLDKALFP